MNHGKWSGFALAAALLASPAFAPTASAQSASHPGTTTTTGTSGSMTPDTTTGSSTSMRATNGTGATGSGSGSTTAGTAASNTNPVLTDNGNVRASKVIGSSVYNDQDQKIGSIDDIILTTDNKPAEAVLSVGGFLGMDSKLVEVPYNKLKFGDTTKNSDNRVMLPGATKDSLTQLQTYRYAGK